MRVIRGSDKYSSERGRPAVAFGNFDGVHLGHRELVDRIRANSAEAGGESVVYTFEPHPVRVLAPSQCPRLLTTLEQKLELLDASGVDAVVVEPFTAEFAHRTAREFFDEIVVGRLNPSSIVCGYDFTFGLHREGTMETLEGMGGEAGIGVEIVPAKFAGETLISSSIIRKMVSDGNVEEAAMLLGRNYSIEGEVVPGRGLGRSLAARTANIRPINEIVPGDGVYATVTKIRETGDQMLSVTSIGDNPTFPDAHYSIETHILEGEIDLLGKRISVYFASFMRETLKFATIEELKAQIGRDIAAAAEFHKRRIK